LIIDAYSHCGITKFLPVEQVLATMEEAGVERAVLAQHLGDYDCGYLSAVVTQHPHRFAAVFLVDPSSPDALNNLRRGYLTGTFRGIRLTTEWLRNNPEFCLAAIDLGMNLLIYAPDGIGSSVRQILEIVRARPLAKIVISHLGNPRVAGQQLLNGSELFQLAGQPSIYVQLSGLSMFCEYPYEPLEGFISKLIECFGPRHVMWGSNFPVCGDSQAYRRDLALVKLGAWGLDQEGLLWVLGRAAKGVWFDKVQQTLAIDTRIAQ
jgi:L-fuconolactonase